MKNKIPAEDNPRNEEAVGGPGAQLRRARERKGIEQSKVAAQLHLSQAKIQALEQDEYEKLSSPVFVQGYLRNYARLLGVDENAVVRAYQELNPGTETMPLPRNQPDEVARELHSDPRLFRLITWAVVVVLGALLFVWLQGRISVPEVESLAPPERADAGAPSPGLPEPTALAPETLEPAPVEPLPLEPVPLEPEVTLPSDQEAATPDLGGTGAEPGLEGETGGLPLDGATGLSVEPSGAPLEEPSTPVVEIESPVPAVQESGGEVAQPLVEFEFFGPCWVEVRDANGRARLFGEMRAGVRRSLGSAPGPYQVVIGDIGVVSLKVNGEPFDMKPFARGKVARFSLDPSRL